MYIIFCRDNGTTAPDGHAYRERYPDGRIPGKFSQATRKTFSSAIDALEYARGYSPERDPFVLDVDSHGMCRMFPVGSIEQMEENCARLELARDLNIDWAC
jgi:hypothetical protein